jgi:hypothetical protein
MATKQELIEEVEEFAKELGVEAKTEGLNHAELSAMVLDLEKRFDAKINATVAAPPEIPRKPALSTGRGGPNRGGVPMPAKLSASSFRYSVASGKALHCLKGALKEGAEVKSEYLSRDKGEAESTLALLLAKGCVLDSRK